jgi:hypothetical protein
MKMIGTRAAFVALMLFVTTCTASSHHRGERKYGGRRCPGNLRCGNEPRMDGLGFISEYNESMQQSSSLFAAPPPNPDQAPFLDMNVIFTTLPCPICSMPMRMIPCARADVNYSSQFSYTTYCIRCSPSTWTPYLCCRCKNSVLREILFAMSPGFLDSNGMLWIAPLHKFVCMKCTSEYAFPYDLVLPSNGHHPEQIPIPASQALACMNPSVSPWEACNNQPGYLNGQNSSEGRKANGWKDGKNEADGGNEGSKEKPNETEADESGARNEKGSGNVTPDAVLKEATVEETEDDVEGQAKGENEDDVIRKMRGMVDSDADERREGCSPLPISETPRRDGPKQDSNGCGIINVKRCHLCILDRDLTGLETGHVSPASLKLMMLIKERRGKKGPVMFKRVVLPIEGEVIEDGKILMAMSTSVFEGRGVADKLLFFTYEDSKGVTYRSALFRWGQAASMKPSPEAAGYHEDEYYDHEYERYLASWVSSVFDSFNGISCFSTLVDSKIDMLRDSEEVRTFQKMVDATEDLFGKRKVDRSGGIKERLARCGIICQYNKESLLYETLQEIQGLLEKAGKMKKRHNARKVFMPPFKKIMEESCAKDGPMDFLKFSDPKEAEDKRTEEPDPRSATKRKIERTNFFRGFLSYLYAPFPPSITYAQYFLISSLEFFHDLYRVSLRAEEADGLDEKEVEIFIRDKGMEIGKKTSLEMINGKRMRIAHDEKIYFYIRGSEIPENRMLCHISTSVHGKKPPKKYRVSFN